MTGDTFTLGELAQGVLFGKIHAMAKLLNDAGANPRLDENHPDPSAVVTRDTVIALYAIRAGDSISHKLAGLLREGIGS